jgi:DNA-binding CsgD family transcriptional regulator
VSRFERAVYRWFVAALTRGELRGALDLLLTLGGEETVDPFPVEVLDRFGKLVGADVVGYCETPVHEGFGGYELVTRPAPSWLYDELRDWGRQDPTHAFYRHACAEPVAISDLLTWREFSQLEVYQRICRPNDVADSIRLYLPTSGAVARFFFFDRKRRGYGRRERDLLTTLRPHLAQRRDWWGERRRPMAAARLSGRERQVMELVATGASNATVATRLQLSPHTVRKHLENIYERLGVHTRTEALAALYSDLRDSPAADGGERR